jgi:hypothetical protein
VLSAFLKYYIGTDKNLNPIYWQLDKVFYLYNGTINSQPVWPDTQRPFGIFGGHLLRYHISEIICIVPSEYEALIFSIYFPNMIWISAATVNTFKEDMPPFAKIRVFAASKPDWARHLNIYLESIGHNSQVLNTKISTTNCLNAGPPDWEYTKPNFGIFASGKYKPQRRLEELYEAAQQNEHIAKMTKELSLTIESITLL